MYSDKLVVLLPILAGKDPWGLVKPFNWQTWLAVLITVPLSVAAVIGVDYFYGGPEAPSNWTKYIGLSLRIFLAQSIIWEPRGRMYGTVFTVISLLTFFVLDQAYSGQR